MLRYQVFLAWGAFWAAIWSILKQCEEQVTETLEFLSIPQDVTHWFIFLFPVWLLVLLAIYAAFTIIYGIATMKDCREAAAEVEQQIKMAKEEMRRRGIPID